MQSDRIPEAMSDARRFQVGNRRKNRDDELEWPHRPSGASDGNSNRRKTGQPRQAGFIVLVRALVLVAIAWSALEFWGKGIDKDTQTTVSMNPDPINAQPSGPGTFDNKPASGGSPPSKATDRDPTPTGNGGGPTMSTTPSGAEKIR
jgi:hypothetical protein